MPMKTNIPQWKVFMKEKHLSPEWLQVYETVEARKADEKNGKPNYRQLYDFHLTPTMYLLDKDKKIIAKKLSLEQFDEIIKVNGGKAVFTLIFFHAKALRSKGAKDL
jgi:hypothetical protein